MWPVSLLAVRGETWRLTSRPDVAVDVLGAGLACCSLEVEAAVSRGLLSPSGDQAPKAVILVVAGTITQALEPAVRGLHDRWAALAPVHVMSFGACATSGGPYWDAPTVVNGVDCLADIEISSYVPGCPPRPEALVAELQRLADSMVVS